MEVGMVGEAHHPGPFGGPQRASGHYLHRHTFAGHDEAGEDDMVDAFDSGPFTGRLVAGIGVWGLILLLML